MIEEKPLTMKDIEESLEYRRMHPGEFRRKMGPVKCFDSKGRRCKDPIEKHHELLDRIIRSYW